MNQVQRILSRLRLGNSVYSTQFTRNHSVHTKVISCFSHSSPSDFTQSHTSSTSNTDLYALNIKHFFSSKPDTVLELLLSSDWSKDLENELKKSNLILTHEIVMYLLKKLDTDPKKASSFFNWAVEKSGFEPSSSMYSLMLRICANKDFLKEFWVTINQMKEKGYYIDEETYKTIYGDFRNLKMEHEATALKHFHERLIKENAMDDLSKEVVQVVKSAEWGAEVEKKLEEMKLSISDNFVLRVLKDLRGVGLHSNAFHFFKWIGESMGFEHNAITYNGILRVLCWEESIQEFWSIVKEMKNAGFEIDLDTYIKVLRQFQKNKMLKDAVELYEHMMDSPFKPSDKECNMLLRSISTCHSPNLDLAFRVVKKYEDAGHSLSKTLYDGIHRSFTSLGRFDEAEKTVEAMRNAGFEPDNITYSQLVFGLCRAKRFEEACEVLDEMEKQGCKPDIKTWTILIQGHCSGNEVDKALLCFAKMMEKGFDPDGDLLDVLINGFLRQNRTGGAHKLLVELVNKVRLRPWQATYKNLIPKLLGERKFEEAMELLRLMKKHNYPPFAEPFVGYISKFGTVENAWEFLKELSAKKNPSVSAYKHVFESFFEEGRQSEAKDLLFKCPHHIRKHQEICSLFGSAV